MFCYLNSEDLHLCQCFRL